MLRMCVLVIVSACGRIGFDPPGSGTDDAAVDSSIDAPGRPAISLVHSTIKLLSNAPSISTSFSHSAETLLVVGAYWNHGLATVTVTDSEGQSWTPLGRAAITTGCAPPGNGTDMELFYRATAAVGGMTIDVTQSTSSDPIGFVVAEYRGVDLVTPLDGVSRNVASSVSSTVSAGTITTSSTSILVGMLGDSLGSGTIDAVTGFATRENDMVAELILIDNVGAMPPGMFTVTGTLPAGQTDACAVGTVAAFRAR